MLSATAPTIFSKKNIDRHLNHIELMVSLPRCLLRCAETVFSWSRHHLSVEKVLRWGKWLVAWQTKSQNQGSVGQDPCNFLHFPLLVVRLARLWFLSAYKSSNFWTCQVVDPKRIEKHEDPWRLVADWMRAGLYLTFPKFLPLSDNFPPKKASNIQTRNSKKKKEKRSDHHSPQHNKFGNTTWQKSKVVLRVGLLGGLWKFFKNYHILTVFMGLRPCDHLPRSA